MSAYPLQKKPKIEIEDEGDPEEEQENGDGIMDEEVRARNEQEEALLALIEHRTKEVEHLRQRITYYTSQLTESERRLKDTQNKLARLRGQEIMKASKKLSNGMEEVKVDRRPASPLQVKEVPFRSQSQFTPPHQTQCASKSFGDDPKIARRPPSPLFDSEASFKNQTQAKPPLVIPAVPSKIPQPSRMKESGKFSDGSISLPPGPALTFMNSITKRKGNKAHKVSPEPERIENQHKGTNKKLDQREHKDLITLMKSKSSPLPISCETGCLLASQHKRKLRSLVLCPTNDQLFATSALDGVVNLWQIQGGGSEANHLSTTDCLSEKQRRWPEDIAWHPQGNKLFSVYSADGGGSQISILDLYKGKERTRVSFLTDKPHVKGIINSIMFMPWDSAPFITGGSDHAVVCWTEKGEDSWKPGTLHSNLHSSAVMGVAGLRHKKIVMSAGADKRIIGFDVDSGRADYKHQIESKCMSVLPNPCDFNLFMVQAGTPERQLKLFDIRLRQTEIHAFGWKQESSESQSALINQAWSPDGYYISSGSADPVIHIFDIRYNSHNPSQSIKAHKKRVFKAAWHHALLLLISISSDLNIGLHKIV